MRKVRIMVVAALTALPLAGLTATPAHACLSPVCDAINLVCEKVTKGQPCVK